MQRRPAAPEAAPSRDNNFDLLRLVAALSVIFSHAFLLAENSQRREPLMILTGGQLILGLVGVFVFFVISGYLVTQSFVTTPSPLRYLVKRVLRIFPGLVVCVFLCAFLLGPLATRLPLADYLTRRGPYLFVLHNSLLDVYVNRLPGVLFGPGTAGGIIDGPLWSLPSEAAMYIVVLGLGVCGLLRRPAALLMLAAGTACLWFGTAGTRLGDVGWLCGFFAAGMALYHLRGPWLVDGRIAFLALAGLVLATMLRLFIVAFPIFGGYLTIYLALTRRLPIVRAARFGDLSYGLYIYGWPVEQAIVYFSGGRAAWWEVFGLAVAITVPLAWLSWHLVESRCRVSGRSAGPVPRLAAAGD